MYAMYDIIYVLLGVIYSCFVVISSVLSVMYALNLLENIFLLFFFKCHFSVMMASGNCLRTASAVNPIHIGKWTL